MRKCLVILLIILLAAGLAVAGLYYYLNTYYDTWRYRINLEIAAAPTPVR